MHHLHCNELRRTLGMSSADVMREQFTERKAKVETLLTKGKKSKAVAKCLKDPPLGAKDQSLKDENFQLVMRCLSAIKNDKIAGIVADLDEDDCDNLMKYVYKGLSTATASGALLKWHEIVLAKAGQGCIVRAITDRKNV